MAILKRLFKRPEPLSVEQKIHNLQGEPQAALVKVIHSNAEDALRQAAVGQLTFSAELLQLATQAGGLMTAARKRLGELLDSGELSLSQLNEQVKETRQLCELTAYSTQAGPNLLADITDDQLLVELASTGATTTMRQAAAEKITAREQLQEVLKRAKDKDKTVYKIVKAKLDQFKAGDAAQRALHDEAEALCHQAQLLTKREVDDIFFARKNQISNAWQALDEQVNQTLAQRFAEVFAQVNAKEQAHLDARAALAERRAAELAAKADLHATLDAGTTLLGSAFAGDDLESLRAAFTQWAEHSVAALSEAEARGLTTSNESRTYQALHTNIESLLDLTATHGALPNLIQTLAATHDSAEGKRLCSAIRRFLPCAKPLKDEPKVVSDARDACAHWQQQQRHTETAARAHIDECFGLVRKTGAAVRNGQVRRAKALFAELEKHLLQLALPPTALQTRVDELRDEMAKLGDWHEFAVAPKKDALIERMRNLAQSPLPAVEQAERVKALQEEWRLLSRGGQHDDSSQWQEFHELSQLAYEPCKRYFDEQTRVRETNLQNRRELCAQLQQYVDDYVWDKAQWQEVEKTLRLAREAWQSYWPVERKANKPVEQKFEALAQAIYTKINGEFERNRAKKQAIVERALQLVELDNTFDAIEGAKRLQTEWQVTGRCKPRDDQALWQQFRVHCDAIFDRRKQETAAEQQEREAARARAEAILQRIEQVLSLTGTEFFAARAEADELSEEFKQLSELPRAHAKKLNQAFNQLQSDLQRKLPDEKRLARQAVWLDVLAAYRDLTQCELAENQTSSEQAKTQLATQLEQANKWPGTLLANMEQRLANPPAGMALPQAEQQLRLLCVRAEINNDLPSPEADRGLRMEYQVNQLQQGLGAQNPDNMLDFEAFLREWLAAPALPLAHYQPLETRMLSAWKMLQQ